jgi:hypothetical protein
LCGVVPAAGGRRKKDLSLGCQVIRVLLLFFYALSFFFAVKRVQLLTAFLKQLISPPPLFFSYRLLSPLFPDSFVVCR